MNAIGEFIREQGVDRSMNIDAAFALKSGADYFNREMCLPAGTRTRMTRVLMRIIRHDEMIGRETCPQFCLDPIADFNLVHRHGPQPLYVRHFARSSQDLFQALITDY